MDKMRDVLEVEDIHVFEVINNRFRHRILRQLITPLPVKELAESLEVPVTRLYYHINQLAQAGVIQVVEERKVGAIVEKVYQTTAKSFRPGKKLLEVSGDPVEMARITAAVVFDQARVDAEVALASRFAAGSKADDLAGTLSLSRVAMSRARAEEFVRKVEELVEETERDDEGDDVAEYSFSVALFPVAGLE